MRRRLVAAGAVLVALAGAIVGGAVRVEAGTAPTSTTATSSSTTSTTSSTSAPTSTSVPSTTSSVPIEPCDPFPSHSSAFGFILDPPVVFPGESVHLLGDPGHWVGTIRFEIAPGPTPTADDWRVLGTHESQFDDESFDLTFVVPRELISAVPLSAPSSYSWMFRAERVGGDCELATNVVVISADVTVPTTTPSVSPATPVVARPTFAG